MITPLDIENKKFSKQTNRRIIRWTKTKSNASKNNNKRARANNIRRTMQWIRHKYNKRAIHNIRKTTQRARHNNNNGNTRLRRDKNNGRTSNMFSNNIKIRWKNK